MWHLKKYEIGEDFISLIKWWVVKVKDKDEKLPKKLEMPLIVVSKYNIQKKYDLLLGQC